MNIDSMGQVDCLAYLFVALECTARAGTSEREIQTATDILVLLFNLFIPQPYLTFLGFQFNTGKAFLGFAEIVFFTPLYDSRLFIILFPQTF